ncbi:glycosyltransferase, partial [Acinetobacter baumannii]
LTGVRKATGTHVLILDADLEYSPADIPMMLLPVMAGVSDHVFGTRVFGLNTRFPSFRFAMGGRVTTAVANLLYDSCLTDMHTC